MLKTFDIWYYDKIIILRIMYKHVLIVVVTYLFHYIDCMYGFIFSMDIMHARPTLNLSRKQYRTATDTAQNSKNLEISCNRFAAAVAAAQAAAESSLSQSSFSCLDVYSWWIGCLIYRAHDRRPAAVGKVKRYSRISYSLLLSTGSDVTSLHPSHGVLSSAADGVNDELSPEIEVERWSISL